MKATLLCLLALTAVAAASSSASYEKVNLGASFMSKMVRRTLLGRQEDEEECEGLCIIHYADPDSCGVGFIHTECEDGEVSLGQFEDGCHCCILVPDVEE